ncbi:MAG: NAD(P)H-hydrate dehydratase [Syntrophomonadaceae bacterium]
MKILSALEMKIIDSRAIEEVGIPGIVLMENAGIRTAEVVWDMISHLEEPKVAVIVGKGNNGGDGLVIARHLINRGVQVFTYLMTDAGQMSCDSLTNYNILKKMTGMIFPLMEEKDLAGFTDTLQTGDLVVDAIYGIGFRGKMGGFESQVAELINRQKLPVVSVDIPSGVEADTGKVHGTAVKATKTVTMALPKLGLFINQGREFTGELIIADISIPEFLLNDANLKTNLITEKTVQSLITPRSPESHKGSYGHALIIGGSMGMSGAVLMAAYAALRCGTGLVTVALPESLVPVVETTLLEVMAKPLAQTAQGAISAESLLVIEKLLDKVSVCAVGPGLSVYPEAREVMRFIVEKTKIPLVIDADGLNALASDVILLQDCKAPIVITPHPGEMARLNGLSIKDIQSNRMSIAKQCAQKWGVTVVLKGNRTIVAGSSGEVFLNPTGNAGMATAGSGDVLCGLITGLMAQGLPPQDAAIAGVYLHGQTGDYVAAKYKGQRGLVAGDLIKYLPDILRLYEES